VSPLEAAIADLLACPCGGTLVLEVEAARCEVCGRRVPIREGVLDFLAEDAPDGGSGKEEA